MFAAKVGCKIYVDEKEKEIQNIWWNLVFALLGDSLSVLIYRKRVQTLKQL
jgi:hypothetical protein